MNERPEDYEQYASLMEAIIAAPDDDLPRLIYADWLEEIGRPEHAEYVRREVKTPCVRAYLTGMPAVVEIFGAGLLCLEIAPAIEGVSWVVCRGFPFKVMLDYPFELADINRFKRMYPIVEVYRNHITSNPSYYFADGTHPSPGITAARLGQNDIQGLPGQSDSVQRTRDIR